MALGRTGARRYAEALLEVATEEKAVPAYRASLERARGALGGDIARWLRDRRVPLEKRREALAAATKGEPGAIRAVLLMLLERDHVGLVGGISAAFADLVDRREGIVKAKITTPIELEPAQRDAIVKRVEQATSRRVRPAFAVDPALLGGVRIQIGDRLIDASVRAQLETLRAQLAT